MSNPEEDFQQLKENPKMFVERLLQYVIASDREATIGRLAPGLSHEINNNLAYISANSDFLLLCKKDILECINFCLENNHGSPDRLKNIVSMLPESIDSLKAGENSAATIVSNFGKTANKNEQSHMLKDSINDALTLCSYMVKHGLEINLELGDPLPPLRGDQTQMSQVLIHLIENSFEAMDNAKQMTIKTYCVEKNIFVEVSDNGPGISEGSNIFEPFFTTKENHAGLGLSIVSNIVSKHNGTIEVDSCAGNTGAKFILTLPAQNSDE